MAGEVRRLLGRAGRATSTRLEAAFGGPARTRVIVLFAAVLALNSADAATVGASATQLRHSLGINNTGIGLLVAVNALAAAVASVPFGFLVDRVRRTRLLGAAIALWGVAMLASATVGSFRDLLLVRVLLGAVTAVAGPAVASMIGDFFISGERGRVYSYVLTGELLGAGLGFAVTGDVSALSWRLAFVLLAVPAAVLAVAVWRLPEPARGCTHPLLPGTRHVPVVPRAARRGAARPEPEEHAPTDAQVLAAARGISPDERLVLRRDPRGLGLVDSTRYVLSIRTNVKLIVASACGYYFLAGVQTFGVEFAKDQYGINQAVANLVMLVLGGGAVAGVLAGGGLGDLLMRRRYLNGRVLVAAVAAVASVVLFIPALTTRSLVTALPYLVLAALMLSAQNPPLDAARLDIMPPSLWGRAEGIRTMLRTAAQALAPLLFGAISDYVFGGGRSGLQATFITMLVPLAVGSWVLVRTLGTYPRDVATAAAGAVPG